jgi:uncharacterized protein YjiS (DUF1127 family)
MPAQMTHTSLAATTTNVAPVSGASVWRWLVLLHRQWLDARKLSRDMEFLRNAPSSLLNDIGINRCDIDVTCKYGRSPK